MGAYSCPNDYWRTFFLLLKRNDGGKIQCFHLFFCSFHFDLFIKKKKKVIFLFAMLGFPNCCLQRGKNEWISHQNLFAQMHLHFASNNSSNKDMFLPLI